MYGCDPLRAFESSKVLGALLIDAIRNPERSFFSDGCPLKTDKSRRLAVSPNGGE